MGPLAIGASLFLASFPFGPAYPGATLDASWGMAIAKGLTDQLQFGTDLVFTHGPLGALFMNQGWPHLYPWTMVYWLGLIAVFTAVLRKALESRSLRVQLLAIAPLLLVQSNESFAMTFLFCVALGAREIAKHWRVAAAAAAAIAMLALSKFSFAMVGAVVVTALAVETFRRNRGAARHAAWGAYCVALVAFWWAAGQRLSGLPAFFVNSFDIAAGHAVSMALPGHVAELRWGIATAALLVAMTITLDRVPMIASAIVVWVAFKAGFVRQDGHTLYFAYFSGGAFALLLARQVSRQRLYWLAPGALCLWLGMAYVAGKLHWGAPRGIIDLAREAWVARLAGIQQWPDEIVDGRNRMRLAAERVATAEPLLRIEGTVDVASVAQGRAIAAGMPWSPRPVFQSYCAYTPSLARLNERHLIDPVRGPRNMFVTLSPIDDRLAVQEDPFIWPLLLTHFEFHPGESVLRFERLKEPRFVTAARLEAIPAGERWAIPDDAAYDWLLLEAQPRIGPGDQLQTLLFRPDPILIELIQDSGEVSIFRYIPSLQDSAFILSPIVNSDADFAALAARKPGSRVRAFRFIEESGATIRPVARPRLTAVSVERRTSAERY